MKYKYLLLDADNTLLDFTRCEHDAITIALSAFGIDPSEENIALYSRINDLLWKKLELGLVTKEQVKYGRFYGFLEALGRTENIDCVSRELADKYMQALSDHNWQLPGAAECCRRLYEAGCKLYVITNGVDFIQNKRVRGSGLAVYFEEVFISDELHAQKPDKAFFDAVTSRIVGFEKERALVVGDSLSSDIKGGIGYGIDTCWLNPGHKTAPSDKMPTYEIYDIGELPGVVLGS